MTTLERQVQIDQDIRRAQPVPEPGSTGAFHRADAQMPVDVGITSVEASGYSIVWDTKTGVSSTVNFNMMRSVLAMTQPDGSLMYTVDNPGITLNHSKFKCILHEEHPEWAYHSEMGFKPCPKANLRTPYDVRMHMQHKHGNENKAIRERKADLIEEEERQVRRTIIDQSLARSASAAPTTPDPEVTVEKPASATSAKCERCSEVLTGKTPQGLASKRRTHDKVCSGK